MLFNTKNEKNEQKWTENEPKRTKKNYKKKNGKQST